MQQRSSTWLAPAGNTQSGGDVDLFTVRDRDRVRGLVLQLAASDERIVAGAVVGSLALDEGDRWSDLDLTFAVADDASVHDVLADWTHTLTREMEAVHLFDVRRGPSIYRVFLLPGCLQFDLSFTPASQFAATGPKFRMVFGESVVTPYLEPPPAHELFGFAVHHALRARFCIERGRYWQAAYWISAARGYALSLACRRRGLAAYYGRGFDDLPPDVHQAFAASLIPLLARDELLSALTCVIQGLLGEVEEAQDLAARVEPQLRRLMFDWGS